MIMNSFGFYHAPWFAQPKGLADIIENNGLFIKLFPSSPELSYPGRWDRRVKLSRKVQSQN
jgi:hypothetical protein